MRVDGAVSLRKFDGEIARLRAQRVELEQRGIFVVGEPTYPVVDLLFVPRHALQVAVPAQQPTLLALPSLLLSTLEVPSLAARAIGVRFDLSEYDARAPSVEFRDPWTKSPLDYFTMFRALEFDPQRKAQVVLLGDHPFTHKPFLCFRGIREYHEHPQHTGDDWMLYRAQSSLFSIILSVWRTCIDLVHPLLVPQQGALQIQWRAEEKP